MNKLRSVADAVLFAMVMVLLTLLWVAIDWRSDGKDDE